MLSALSAFEAQAFALLRIVAGFLFGLHGVQKLFGRLTERPRQRPGSQAWWGGLIELACGLALVLGWHSREAAFLASGTMAVAYTQFHWKFKGGAEFFPVVNKGELAVLYCFIFLLIACHGGGAWALLPD